MMERRLKMYLWWKAQLGEGKHFGMPDSVKDGVDERNKREKEQEQISAALKKKDAIRNQRAASRRRVRGGGPSGAPTPPGRATEEPVTEGMNAKEREKLGILSGEGEMIGEAGLIADL